MQTGIKADNPGAAPSRMSSSTFQPSLYGFFCCLKELRIFFGNLCQGIKAQQV